MKERFDNTLPYLIVTVIFYYSLPFICYALKSPFYNLTPAVDVCVSMAVGFFYGKRFGGDWLMALEAAAVFIPCVYMFFNQTAWIYVLVIAIFSAFAVFIGAVFRKRVR